MELENIDTNNIPSNQEDNEDFCFNKEETESNRKQTINYLNSIVEDAHAYIDDTPREPKFIITDWARKGVGQSYYLQALTEDAHVLKFDESDSQESLEAKIAEAKAQEKKVVVIGSGVGRMSIMEKILGSGLACQVFVDDLKSADFEEEYKVPMTVPKWKENEPISIRNTHPADDFSNRIAFDDGVSTQKKNRSGGNNRKLKKRKKAKNGRNKRK